MSAIMRPMSARPAATPAHSRASRDTASAAPSVDACEADAPMRAARRRISPWWVALVAGLSLASCRPRDAATSPARDAWTAGSDAAREHAITRTRAPVGLPEPVLDFLAQETLKNLAQLQGEGAEVPAYFLAYDLIARDHLWLEAQNGQIVRNRKDSDRTVDVDVRVGSRQLDNSHPGDANYGPGNGLRSEEHTSELQSPVHL